MWGASSSSSRAIPPPIFVPASSAGALSFYDLSPLQALLERLIDFDRVNAGGICFSVGSTHIKTGQLRVFDNATRRVQADHIIARGSLPPGFPSTEIDGEHYWDGGVVSNTPLQWLLDCEPPWTRCLPGRPLERAARCRTTLIEVDVRMKDIRYSSRTRKSTDQFRNSRRCAALPKAAPAGAGPELRQTPEAEMMASVADDKVHNIVHMIYRASYEAPPRTTSSPAAPWRSTGSRATRTCAHARLPDSAEAADHAGRRSTFDLTSRDRAVVGRLSRRDH